MATPTDGDSATGPDGDLAGRATADDERDYRVRWFEPRDREAFLALYNDTFGGGTDSWFDWKFRENPYTSNVPILVAQSPEGEFAGARPQVPLRMRVGDENVLAYRFGDTMVHPDHRRRGVFTRMTERALDHYGESRPRFCFNFPNDVSRPGYLNVGGVEVGEIPSFYRVNNPGALVDSRDEGDLVSVVAGALSPAIRGYGALRTVMAGRPTDATIVEHADVPAERLASLYRRGVPEGVHVVRDPVFLDWRYRNPRWEYTVYSAEIDDTPVAALVTGRQAENGFTVINLVEAYPPAVGDDAPKGLRAILQRVVRTEADVDLFAASGRVVPPRLLRAVGFLPDGRPPLSWTANRTRLVAYDVGGADAPDWTVGGLDLRKPRNWALSSAELDAR